MNFEPLNLQPEIKLILSQKVKDKINAEKVNLLLQNLYLSLPATVILATIMLINLLDTPFLAHYIVWYIVILLLSLLRASLIVIYKYFPEKSKTILIFFIVGTILSAICWGALASYLMAYGPQSIQLAIIVMVGGLSAGGSQTLQPNLIATLSSLYLMIIPLCIWFYLQNDIHYFILGIASIIYLFLMSIISIRGVRQLTSILSLKHENEILMSNLSHSNSELKSHEQSMLIINKMNETLQLCQDEEEIYGTIKLAATRLFPNINGGLTLLDNENNQHLVLHWGDESILQISFASIHCWAFRKGELYIVNDPHQELLCHHYTTIPEGHCICLPLIVSNTVIGLLNFNLPQEFSITNYTKQIITSFGNAIKLSLDKNKLIVDTTVLKKINT